MRVPHTAARIVAAIVLAAVLALILRVPSLDRRPMHGDEANQAVRAGILIDSGQYTYDPVEHHGPTLYYLALLSATAQGQSQFQITTESTYRIIPALFGVALVLLLIPLRQTLGSAAVIAAILTAISPAFVFYSRYFIQEVLLVCFTFGAIATGWRYTQRPSTRWAIMCGAYFGLMHATKETAIIAYMAMAASTVLTALWARREGSLQRALREIVKPRHVFVTLAVATGISITLYSSFFTHASGPLDSLLTYRNYLGRADGAGVHDKPWYYYLSLLLYVHRSAGPYWSEAAILIMALVGAGAILRKAEWITKESIPLLRFLLLYTVLMTVAYSVIPYKTPWNLLSFYHGMILIAGLGGAHLIFLGRNLTGQVLVRIVLVFACVHLTLQSLDATNDFEVDVRNPYVYAHTTGTFMRLIQRMDNLSDVHPDGKSMLIRIIQSDHDYWPIPWYLRAYGNVGYWPAPPDDPNAPVIITDLSTQPTLDKLLHGEYITEFHGLRPDVIRIVYIRRDLWDAFMETRE